MGLFELIDNRIRVNRINTADHSSDYRQRQILELPFSRLQIPFMVDEPRVSLEMEPIDCVVLLQRLSDRFCVFLLDFTERNVHMNQSLILFQN